MIEELQKTYLEKRAAIRARLAEFEAVLREGDDRRLFEELVFCIFTAGGRGGGGVDLIRKVRPPLPQTGRGGMSSLRLAARRYPTARSRNVLHPPNILRRACGY